MEGKFTHYLVTRFNVKIDGYGPEYFTPDIRHPSWEEERLPLFEHFCAPTVSGQRAANFTWLIYCDVKTDPDIIRRIQRIVNLVASVELIFVADYEAMISHLKQLCAGAPTPFVITSRLDNDDGLGREYIYKVQENFEPSGNVILNCTGGVIYHMEKGILTHLHLSPNNSFISLIEAVQPMSGLLTVYGFRHLAPPEMIQIKNIDYPYAFWMNLHQHNAGRRGNRGRPTWPGWLRQHYAIAFTLVRISWFNMLWYTIRWLPRTLASKIRNVIFGHP